MNPSKVKNPDTIRAKREEIEKCEQILNRERLMAKLQEDEKEFNRLALEANKDNSNLTISTPFKPFELPETPIKTYTRSNARKAAVESAKLFSSNSKEPLNVHDDLASISLPVELEKIKEIPVTKIPIIPNKIPVQKIPNKIPDLKASTEENSSVDEFLEEMSLDSTPPKKKRRKRGSSCINSLQKEREYKRKYRLTKETPEQKQKQTEYKRNYRLTKETEEQKRKRSEYKKIYRLTKETPEQRQKQNENRSNHRLTKEKIKSELENPDRLQKSTKTQEGIEDERREKQKTYQRQKISRETEEQRKERLERDRVYKRLKLQLETPEEKQERLKKKKNT